ncbi:hypothetical protein [Planctomyces sp. SH-PL62]|uniref:hypothetical protein n=1 Tax=Planctomyces sp. SH-PL62 TaxID=1636152 RepID=UPI0018D3ADE3|nr:hypothetical protein [Planctomyces sp. SH-PL62]
MMIIPLAGISLPLILVPLILVFKHVGRNRDHRHLERMQAIKAGRPLQSASNPPGAGSVVAIGAGVPCASMFGALLATASISSRSPDFMPMMGLIWGSAAVVGLGGLLTAFILGVLSHQGYRRDRDREASEALGSSAKPAYDPDLFDAAGRGY